MSKFQQTIDFIKDLFPNQEFIPLHEPRFIGNERKYVMDAIDSTFVSSVGEYVDQFELMMAKQVGSKFAVATVNGTSALHLALLLADVKKDDEVLTQALTFVATANAITYIGAAPVFLDVDLDTLGLSPDSLQRFLIEKCEKRNGITYNRFTHKKIAACIPMHTFGFPCKIDRIVEICQEWNIKVVEDAAESIGSYYKNRHTGSFGLFGTFSLNGNKTITCGGGGAILTNNEVLAKKAKHLSTQAKITHKWEYVHDETGYNYRMPNLNAAMACAQLEKLAEFIKNKRSLADHYNTFFSNSPIKYFTEGVDSYANYWLNTILLKDKKDQQDFLEYTNKNGIMTRPAWCLMSHLEVFKDYQTGDLKNSLYLSDRIVNIPSSFRKELDER